MHPDLEFRLTDQQIVDLAARSKRGPTIRTHTSPTPLDGVRAVEQTGLIATGLWFDLHCGWIGCGLFVHPSQRQFYVGLDKDEKISGRYVYRVDLGASNILRITTAAAFDEFEERFATRYAMTTLAVHSPPSPSRPWDVITPTVVKGRHVDWSAVAREYDGIEVAPRRIDRPAKTAAHTWYADFDDIPEGGCVWRPRDVRVTFLGRIPGHVSTWIPWPEGTGTSLGR